MSLASVRSRAMRGLEAVPVTVEVHLANGLPSFTLVGLADTEVKEARERVRSAITNAGFEFPNNKRITVNLAPADLPKDSGRFDLPMAVGLLAASGQMAASALADHEFAGELSLSGELRPVRGALAMSLSIQQQALALDRPAPALVLPVASARDAAWVPGVAALGAGQLLDVVAHCQAVAAPSSEAGTNPASAGALAPQRLQPTVVSLPPVSVAGPDLADVRGQASARRALEIAAAGGHSLLMVGPPGVGKSMLAQRLPGLLPPLDITQALEHAAVASLSGHDWDASRWRQRPWRAPHHSASAVALVGGGSPPRPGEVSLAHHGVLFLDELPEFPRSALEALREPLETGHISIARAAMSTQFPARFQLVAAMNPCPCGRLGSANGLSAATESGARLACRCTPDQIQRYQARLSGPLLDRIDLLVQMNPVPPDELLQSERGEASAAVQARCHAASERALRRQGSTNAALYGAALDAHAALDAACGPFLRNAAQRLGWSARATHRVLRVARTIADLAGSQAIQIIHLAEAVQYRRALPSADAA